MATTTASTTNTGAITSGFVGSVVYSITVNGTAATNMQYAFDAELRQSYGAHDMFFVRFEFPHGYPSINTLSLWPTNALVSITWGRAPNTQTWYGYLNHYEINSDSDSGLHNQQVTYVCIGTSKVMNSDSTTIWQNTTAPTVASTIASTNYLRAVVTNTSADQTLDYEVQSGESDFAFLNRMADKYGYRFFVSGGTLYFVDPAAALASGNTTTNPTYTMDKSLAYQDTLRNFQWNQGDNLPGGTLTNKTIYALDASSGQVVTATAPASAASTTTYINTNRIVTSQADAQDTVNSWQSLSQFWIGGTAQTFGNPLLYPGKVITLGGASLPGGAAGNWMVTSARHQMKVSGFTLPNLDRFATDVQIVRNNASADVTLTGSNAVSPEFVTMSSSGSQWQSSATGTTVSATTS